MRRFATYLRCFGIAVALATIACHSPESKLSDRNANTRSYAAKGVVEHISSDHHVVTIHHQAIPGYMMEMTMDFPVRDEHLMDGFSIGDQIDFTLMVSDEDAWVRSVHRTGHLDQPPPNTSSPVSTVAPLKPGDLLPDVEFIAESGRHIHLSDFRGNVVVFTFFFTRCPLPNYCPLMNREFAQTRALLLAQPAAPQNWQFLSISFDPDFDTPSVLTFYADYYRSHNGDRWLFAAATPDALARLAAPVGLIVMRQGNSLSHNLRTVVVDPGGRLFCQFNDNQWTAQQLAQAVIDANKPSAK